MSKHKPSCQSKNLGLPNVKNGSLKTEYEEWLTTDEAAYYLKVSPKTLLNMASNGKIPFYKFGRRNRYLRSELKRLLLSESRGVLNGY